MDYKNAKIYKITDIGYNKMYIGSTCQPLYKRLSKHKCDYKLWKNGKGTKTTSYDLFDEFGVDNCKIELIEECPCDNREQLHGKEGIHIKNNVCVNKYIAGRTQKESKKIYDEVNRDKIRERYKQYCEENEEHIKDRMKKYYELNKQHIKEYKNQYYELNKEKILEKQKAYRESKKNKSKSLEIPTD